MRILRKLAAPRKAIARAKYFGDRLELPVADIEGADITGGGIS